MFKSQKVEVKIRSKVEVDATSYRVKELLLRGLDEKGGCLLSMKVGKGHMKKVCICAQPLNQLNFRSTWDLFWGQLPKLSTKIFVLHYPYNMLLLMLTIFYLLQMLLLFLTH